MTTPRLRAVDVNLDAGEGLDDAALAPHVTSLNIACGGHVGDARTMRTALELAARAGLRAGAHPSYPDPAGFGRRREAVDASALEATLSAQLEAIRAVAAEVGIRLTHVKPHGALYHDAWRDPSLARLVARAALAVLPGARLVLPAASPALMAVDAPPPLAEVFLDRRYAVDGGLLPRSEPGAVITDPAELETQVTTVASLEFQTMCVHSDNPSAGGLLRALPAVLASHGLRMRAYSPA